MTVTLIETGLANLLEHPAGPVSLFVHSVADEIVDEASKNVRDYFQSAPTLNVHDDVGKETLGEIVAVGIRNAGTKSRRMAAAQANGTVGWLARAQESVRVRRAAGG